MPQCTGIHTVYIQYVCFVQCSIWNSIMHYDTVLYIWVQPSAPAHAKMEGPAQLLTLALVMWGGLECSVKQVLTETAICRFGSVPLSCNSPKLSKLCSVDT